MENESIPMQNLKIEVKATKSLIISDQTTTSKPGHHHCHHHHRHHRHHRRHVCRKHHQVQDPQEDPDAIDTCKEDFE